MFEATRDNRSITATDGESREIAEKGGARRLHYLMDAWMGSILAIKCESMSVFYVVDVAIVSCMHDASWSTHSEVV
jgi:hypothetical protein